MTYKEIYDHHIQLLHVYENNEKHQGPYQTQIDLLKVLCNVRTGCQGTFLKIHGLGIMIRVWGDF